jgi:hypothetical protein
VMAWLQRFFSTRLFSFHWAYRIANRAGLACSGRAAWVVTAA